MSPHELGAQCAKVIQGFVEMGEPAEKAQVLITTPPGWKAPPRFPRGEIIRHLDDGSRVRYLPAMNVLAWLTAHGLIKVASAETGEEIKPRPKRARR